MYNRPPDQSMKSFRTRATAGQTQEAHLKRQRHWKRAVCSQGKRISKMPTQDISSSSNFGTGILTIKGLPSSAHFETALLTFLNKEDQPKQQAATLLKWYLHIWEFCLSKDAPIRPLIRTLLQAGKSESNY